MHTWMHYWMLRTTLFGSYILYIFGMYKANGMHWLWFYMCGYAYMHAYMHKYMHTQMHYWMLRKNYFGPYVLYIFGMYKAKGMHWLWFYMYVYAFIHAYMHKYMHTWMHYWMLRKNHFTPYILYIFGMYKANELHWLWFYMYVYAFMHAYMHKYMHTDMYSLQAPRWNSSAVHSCLI